MGASINIAKDYMPDNLVGKISVVRAYMAKVGYVRLKIKEDYLKDDKELFDKLLNEVYSKLSKSPHIMDVSPRQEDLLRKDDRDKSFMAAIHLGTSTLSLTLPLALRVVINKRKQEELHRMVFQRMEP